MHFGSLLLLSLLVGASAHMLPLLKSQKAETHTDPPSQDSPFAVLPKRRAAAAPTNVTMMVRRSTGCAPRHQGTSDVEGDGGDYMDYGDYEDVGTPVVTTRVSH